MKGRGPLMLEIACWFALFVLIGVYRLPALTSNRPLAAFPTRYMRER